MFTKRRLGFTLTEMLVVIGIIAALTAILLPVFASARHQARTTACASNLHQISLALHQYAADSDDYYPMNAIRPALHLAPFWTLLTPYTHNMEVFHCPEAWGTYEAVGGYDYRGASQVFSIGLENIQPPRQPRRGSGTVVAVCNAHVRRLGPDAWATDADGKFLGTRIVVREDGSTSQVQAEQVEYWVNHNGQWALSPHGPRVMPQVGDLTNWRYPGEEWPSQD